MPYISTVCAHFTHLLINSLQHTMSRHYCYPYLTDEETEIQRLTQNQSWSETQLDFESMHSVQDSCLTTMHTSFWDRWLGMESQKYERLIRAHLVQWSSHWPLENQVQFVNTNPRWLWFSKSRVELRNLHFLKLPKVKVLEKPLVWFKTPWWTHEFFTRRIVCTGLHLEVLFSKYGWILPLASVLLCAQVYYYLSKYITFLRKTITFLKVLFTRLKVHWHFDNGLHYNIGSSILHHLYHYLLSGISCLLMTFLRYDPQTEGQVCSLVSSVDKV